MKIARGFGSFLYTLAIYVGLPLLGWGMDDLSGFFSFPQLFGYSMSIAAFGLLAGYILQYSGGLGNQGKGLADKFVPRQRIVRVLITGMLFCALIFVPLADRYSVGTMVDTPLIRWIGLILEILGMGLIFWSGMALGKLYSPEVTLQKEHRLITAGPYHLIRHPRYLGGMIQGIGLSLLFRSWIGLALTIVFVVIIVFRIHDEETLMRKEFGETWQDYCQRSWRLIPLIY